jgi:hypothetical protein
MPTRYSEKDFSGRISGGNRDDRIVSRWNSYLQGDNFDPEVIHDVN